jgi:hypothetical protein
MAILPRSPRAICLFAGAVWLATCAGLWQILPLKPLAVMSLADEERLLGFAPDGATALVLRSLRASVRPPYAKHYALRIFSVSNGRTVAELLRDCQYLIAESSSIDGRYLIIREPLESGFQYWFVDLVAPFARALSIRGFKHWMPDQFGLSPDGRYCVFASYYSNPPLMVWNCATDEHVRSLDGLRPPFQISSNGRWFAAAVQDHSDSVEVFDLANMTRRARLTCRPDESVIAIQIGDDGSEIVFGYRDQSIRYVPLRESRAQGYLVAVRYADDHSVLATSEHRLDSYDWNTGLKKFSIVAPRELYRSPALSPDRRTILVPDRAEPSPFYVQLVRVTRSIGLMVKVPRGQCTCRLYDAGTGREAREFTFDGNLRDLARPAEEGLIEEQDWPFIWIAGGKQLAVRQGLRSRDWEIWQVPPRPSLTWFTAGAALLALPIGFMAWRRVRKLRAA